MPKQLTLGSLFDGSGGFPFGAILTGIEPIWASEVAPFPIRVTTKRLSQVKHLGDINRIDGAKTPPVDIVTAGFCCQDLSCAGKRAGLHGERSGLFFQIIRIVREMRAATNGEYPSFLVLENVPGIYSSANGADFLEVLNELANLKSETAEAARLSIPMPGNGKWSTAGEIRGRASPMEDSFSIAWRTIDAQLWGVPQRRRRCFLVVDLAGGRAGAILFDESRLRGDPAQGRFPWQNAPDRPAQGAGSAIGCELGAASRLGGHCWRELAGTLRADAGDNQAAVVYEAQGDGDGEFVVDPVKPMTDGYESIVTDDTTPVMSIAGNIIDRTAKSGGNGLGVNEDVSFTLNTMDRHAVCYSMTVGGFMRAFEEIAPPLQARDYKDAPIVNQPRYVVRRLTPQEYSLLQGFPPDWCAGLETPEPSEEDIAFWTEVWATHCRVRGASSRPKSRSQIVKWLRHPYSEAAEYTLWGNGVCLNVVVFVLSGIVTYAQEYDQDLGDTSYDTSYDTYPARC